MIISDVKERAETQKMGLKICFYASTHNKENEEIDLLNYYNNEEEGHCIYKIEAGEVCSEFIARYFKKSETIPDLLLNKIVEEKYANIDCKSATEDMKDGIYKAITDKMLEDIKSKFELKTFKESKKVREELIEKYKTICEKLNKTIEKPKVDIYALFEV